MSTDAFTEWRGNLPYMSKHMTAPERTVAVVEWLVAVCGWDGVAEALETHAAQVCTGAPELVRECGANNAVPSLLRLATHLVEAAK